MSEPIRPVTVKFSLSAYFLILMSIGFLIWAFIRYGHVFWWVYIVGAILGIVIVPGIFFLRVMKYEYRIHQEVHALDETFFTESTDGTLGLDIDDEEDIEGIEKHVQYTKRFGSMTFGEWLHTAFDEGIGRTKLSFKSSVLPVYKQSAFFGAIIGMTACDILLVITIVVVNVILVTAHGGH